MIDWFDLLADQGTLKSLLQHHNSEASVLQRAVKKENGADKGGLGARGWLQCSQAWEGGFPEKVRLEPRLDLIGEMRVGFWGMCKGPGAGEGLKCSGATRKPVFLGRGGKGEQGWRSKVKEDQARRS